MLTYKELLKENARLKLQLSDTQNNGAFDELKKKNRRLSEYNEELKQTFETIKQNKERLEESEARFRLLEKNISDVIWMIDLNGNFTFVSSSVEQLFGYNKNEFTGLTMKDVLTESAYAKHRSDIALRIEREKKGELTTNLSFELQHIKKDGEVFWAEISADPIRDKENNLIGILGVTRDISGRIEIENEIKKLSVAIEQSPASIVITDVKGKIEYVNLTFSEITGYSYEEVIGKNPGIVKSGETSRDVYISLWSTIKKGEVWKGELINRTKKGETYWERVIIAPITNHEGEIVNFVAVKENITAQKIAEQELKDSQERYKRLSDISLEGIIIHENGLIQDVNNSVTRITGYSSDELIGKESVEKLFNPESIKIIRKNVAKKYKLPYEVTGIRKDDTLFPAEVEARGYSHKGIEMRVAVLRDITYRKRVEDVLRSSLKMNELLNTHSESEIIDWGLEEAIRLSESSIGFFYFVNDDQNAISLQAWLKETLKKYDVPDKSEHYPIDKAGTWADCFYQRKPVVHNNYETLPHKKGLPKGHFPLKRYISLPIIEGDKVKIIFGVGNKNKDYDQFDVDVLSLFAKTIWMVIQRKRIEKELTESNASKDKFFSIISHDLRSPIGSIRNLTDVLFKNIEKFSVLEIKNFIKTIRDTSKNTYNLLENMLLWAKAHRQKIEFSPQIINLNETVNEVIQIYQLEATKKNITLSSKIRKNIVVKADLEMLKTVLRNLVSNAIKFTHKNGTVEIVVPKYTGTAAQVSVIDNGVGIPKEKISRLFSIDETITTKGTENESGTGLGLVLCKEFVERNGGKIWVESLVNKGSKFCFTLPLKK